MKNEDNTKASSLTCQPQSIDFGSLSPGQDAHVTLSVRGGPGKVCVRSDQLAVAPSQWEEQEGALEVTLLGGSSGELIWDEIALQTDTDELRVPITARWSEYKAEASVADKVESNASVQSTVTQPPEGKGASGEERNFKGRSCSLCAKNFGYNTDSGSWEQCTCTWYQMAINASKRIVRELRYGAKDIPSYLQETWRLILGKEKM